MWCRDLSAETTIRERKQQRRRRRRQREWQNSIGLDLQNDNFAGVSRFFIHFFAATARVRREMPNFTICRGRQLSFFLPEL